MPPSRPTERSAPPPVRVTRVEVDPGGGDANTSSAAKSTPADAGAGGSGGSEGAVVQLPAEGAVVQLPAEGAVVQLPAEGAVVQLPAVSDTRSGWGTVPPDCRCAAGCICGQDRKPELHDETAAEDMTPAATNTSVPEIDQAEPGTVTEAARSALSLSRGEMPKPQRKPKLFSKSRKALKAFTRASAKADAKIMALTKAHRQIAKIYEDKIKADLVDDRDGNRRQEMPNFM